MMLPVALFWTVVLTSLYAYGWHIGKPYRARYSNHTTPTQGS